MMILNKTEMWQIGGVSWMLNLAASADRRVWLAVQSAGGAGQAARTSATAPAPCLYRVSPRHHHARHGRRWHGRVSGRIGAGAARRRAPWVQQQQQQEERPEQAAARTVHPSAHLTRSSTRGRAGHHPAELHHLTSCACLDNSPPA